MTNRKRIIFALFWILIGAVFLIYSGRAEGFVSVRSILVFFVIALIGTIFWNIITVIKIFWKKDYTRGKTELKFLAAKFLAIGLIIGGHTIDNHRITETMNTGNSLIEAVEQYKMKEGDYPASLDLPQFQNYKPSLKDSVFSISKDNQSEFSISFDSVTFMICTRKNTQPDWYCDD